ncbi:hypothetical protein OQX61_01540 [Pedobacter sp. PLR]|uniref:hypothetical protein n=1 Tax=Pedobacter sp. PLR TaxID=2994465 RepID=UPI002245C704|nr:hypothetical protein [Pedobacter sp. PLR]MCX2449941.1 hypothetical protein [Pedobacter sp. PLR]
MKNLLINLTILASVFIGSVFANKNITHATFYVQDIQGHYNRIDSHDFDAIFCFNNTTGICAYLDLSNESYPPALPTTLTAEQVRQLSDPANGPITLEPLMIVSKGYYDTSN